LQTAIGHWGEMMFPLFSILKREPDFQWPPSQFLLLHLKRVSLGCTHLSVPFLHLTVIVAVMTANLPQVHLLEWARAVIATTLGVLPSRALPPVLMQQETDSVWDQICMQPPKSGRHIKSSRLPIHDGE